MRKGDILICRENVNNFLDMPLFEKGKEYKVLYIDEQEVTLNHNLYANEYQSYPIKWVNEKFTTLDEFRNNKLNKILK